MESPTQKRTIVSAAIISFAAVLVYLSQFVSLNLLMELPRWTLWVVTLSPPPLFGGGIGNLFRRPLLGASLGILVYLFFCAIRYRLFVGGHFVPNLP
jgi:hypothetical protein